jgi:hypothetical protein
MPILVGGKPRKILLQIPSSGSGKPTELSVEVRSSEAVMQALFGLSEERTDELRASILDSSVPLARPVGARALPLHSLLMRLVECFEAQIHASRLELEAGFDEMDADEDGAISSAEFTKLLHAKDRSIEPAALSALMHKVHEASERLEPAVGDALLRQAYTETMMRGGPNIIPAIELTAEFVGASSRPPSNTPTPIGMNARRSSLPTATKHPLFPFDKAGMRELLPSFKGVSQLQTQVAAAMAIPPLSPNARKRAARPQISSPLPSSAASLSLVDAGARAGAAQRADGDSDD